MKNLLNVLKVTDLKVVAKELSVKGYSKVKKAELVDMIADVLSTFKSVVTDNHDITRYTSKEEIVKDINHEFSFVLFNQKLDADTMSEDVIQDIINVDGFDTITGIAVSPVRANRNALNTEHAFGVNIDMSNYDYCTAFNLNEDANIFVVNNNATVNLLKLITNNDITKVKTLFDGLYIDLNGFQKLVVFDLTTIDLDNAKEYDLTDLNDRIVKVDRKSKSKRNMFSIHKFDLKVDCNNGYIVSNKELGCLEIVKATTPVKIGENRLFRAFNEYNENGEPSVNHFIIISTASLYGLTKEDNQVAEVTVKNLLLNGIVFNGKRYRVMLQSASQSRTGKFLFTDLDNVEEILDDLMFGGYKYLVAAKNIAKGQSRIGLITTTTKNVGTGYTFAKLISNNDLAIEKEREVYVMKNNGTEKQPKYAVVKTKRVIEAEPADGQGSCSLLCALRFAKELGLVSMVDSFFFVKHVNYIRDVKAIVDKEDKTDDDLRVIKIFNKIPKAFQIRHGSADKGLLFMFDHDLYGYTEDIVLTTSMRKIAADKADEDMPVEIANWQKSKKDMAYMNYQFWNALDLDNDDIKKISQEIVDKIDNDILINPNSALKFLGLISNIGDSFEDDNNLLVSKITKVLTINPAMIRDTQVIKGIRRLLEEFLNHMRFGKIPVEGSFCYFLSDPIYMLSKGKESGLQDGEFFFNNTNDTYGVFRSPLVYRGEAFKANAVPVDAYWYLQDMMIFNPYGDEAQRAGGADFDGDQGLITKVKAIVNTINSNLPLIHDDGPKDSIVKVWDNEHLIKHYLSTSKRSQIGNITNIATRMNEIGYATNNRMISENHMVALRLLQGWEIDSAKHGKRVIIPDALKTNKYNLWFATLKGKVNENGKLQTNAPIDVYHKPTPMQNNFDFMTDYIKTSNNKEVNNINMSIQFLQQVDNEELKEILPLIYDLEIKYRKDLGRVNSMIKVENLSEEDASELRTSVYEEYTVLLDNLISQDNYKTNKEMLLAAACYEVCYSRDGHNTDSVSFLWICAFDGFLKLLYSKNTFMLTRINGVDEVNSFEIKNHVIYVNNSMYMTLNADKNGFYRYEDDKYEVVKIENEFYFKAPKRFDVFKEIASSTDIAVKESNVVADKTMYRITFNGFRYYENENYTASFIDKIFNNNLEMDLVDVNGKMTVFVDDKAIGVVSKKDNINLVVLLENHSAVKLQVINTSENSDEEYKKSLIDGLKYVPKENRKTTVWINDNYAMRQELNLTVVNIGELEKLPESLNTTSEINSPVSEDISYEPAIYDNAMMYTTDDINPIINDSMVVTPIDDELDDIKTVDFVDKRAVKFLDMTDIDMTSQEVFNNLNDFDYLVLYKRSIMILFNHEGKSKPYTATLEQARVYAERLSK